MRLPLFNYCKNIALLNNDELLIIIKLDFGAGILLIYDPVTLLNFHLYFLTVAGDAGAYSNYICL